MNEAKNIQWFPDQYEQAAVVAQEVLQAMLARLDWMTLEPKTILDVGCGPGLLTSALKNRYPNAHIISIDNHHGMLTYAKNKALFSVQAEANQLPIKDHSIDLVIANLLLPWCDDVTTILKAWRQVLRSEGLVMFSVLGWDTLQEFKNTEVEIIPHLVDMHNVGDALIQQGFLEPVLDVDYYTTTYKDSAKLAQELILTGMTNNISKAVFNHLPKDADGSWPVTYEIIHAHAFTPSSFEAKAYSEEGVTRIPLSQLRHTLRAKN